jgi:hypothetical protein
MRDDRLQSHAQSGAWGISRRGAWRDFELRFRPHIFLYVQYEGGVSETLYVASYIPITRFNLFYIELI